MLHHWKSPPIIISHKNDLTTWIRCFGHHHDYQPLSQFGTMMIAQQRAKLSSREYDIPVTQNSVDGSNDVIRIYEANIHCEKRNDVQRRSPFQTRASFVFQKHNAPGRRPLNPRSRANYYNSELSKTRGTPPETPPPGVPPGTPRGYPQKRRYFFSLFVVIFCFRLFPYFRLVFPNEKK